jgi:hypothetical protein
MVDNDSVLFVDTVMAENMLRGPSRQVSIFNALCFPNWNFEFDQQSITTEQAHLKI